MGKQHATQDRLQGLNFEKSGKVRDIYSLGDNLLMVASDRISCFDVVLPTAIPQKGEVLTRLSVFWFDFLKDVVANHFVTDDIHDFPEEIKLGHPDLEVRSMIVRKADPLPFECIVRGYLSGSAWKEYQKEQTVCGQKMPEGLRESDKLPAPIFTPSTKEDEGHDINVSFDSVEEKLGKELAGQLRDISLKVYKKASEYAETRGIIIADTKFEFGKISDGSVLILIDEVLTPDSSRFWPKDEYAPGKPQPSFDKQYVRDYLETLDWGKTYPGPELPDDIIRKTTEKYLQAYAMLTKDK